MRDGMQAEEARLRRGSSAKAAPPPPPLASPPSAGAAGTSWLARRAAAWALALLFLATIWLPAVEMRFHLFPAIDALDRLERRRTDTPPWFSPRQAPSFLPAVANYFRYNFGFRGLLVRWDATLGLEVLHASPSSRLIFGRDGWIFYCSEKVPDGVTIQDFQGLAPFRAAEVATIRGNLARQARWCRDHGIVCVFAVVPNKETVYPEYLPRSIRRIAPRTRLDQVVEAVRADTAIHLIDLRPVMREAKGRSSSPLYNKGGTHWNGLGAFYAYRSIAGELSKGCPALRPYGLEDFDVHMDPHSSFDHTLGLGENCAYDLRLKPGRADPARCAPALVVVHDSFWDALEPFLTLHARRVVARGFVAGSTLHRDLLAREHPAAVLYLVVERYLTSFLDS